LIYKATLPLVSASLFPPLLQIAVADATQHAWLDQRWRALIERTLRRVAPGIGVRFTVASAGAA